MLGDCSIGAVYSSVAATALCGEVSVPITDRMSVNALSGRRSTIWLPQPTGNVSWNDADDTTARRDFARGEGIGGGIRDRLWKSGDD